MRKWHRFVPAAASISSLVVIVEVVSALQKW